MLDEDATPAPGDDLTPAAPGSEPATPTLSTPPDSDESRFVPGTVVADRYRVVGLLGRGGMGEVYRADDLKLGQSVALKFLPQGLDHDPERLQRFLGEVRTALRITHPNVCRVYDLGEVSGAHYLSMEYIDGEDLSSLLRRIGRLPEDKAIQIARQLCAGLAAAHDQGILHRDLKPANVMLDGRGDVKITDFGLAGLAEGFTGLEIRAGTPAFMAPEQLAGKEVTARSDVYSLGLVLYQLFTGKKAFVGESLDEITALQQSGPTRPSSHIQLLDPSVEQVILRCLSPDPAERPASAVKVALGLPGADPLAAALAAGETPSPEMVAEAGDDEGLPPKIAVPILVFTLLGLLATAGLIGRYQLLGRVPMELPAQVLAHQAQEIAHQLGYEAKPKDRAYGFAYDRALLLHLNQDPSSDRWDRLATERPTGIYMWYRQSPRTLIPRRGSQVSFDNPPVQISGMVNVHIDSTGRLRFFKAVPPQFDDTAAAAGPADWTAAFKAAGLDLESFRATPPQWLPETYCNQRSAWLGSYPAPGNLPIRVEACAYNGRPVYFSILHSWDRPSRQETQDGEDRQQLANLVGGLVSVALILGAVLLMQRNLKLGRGDRGGAWRLAGWATATLMGAWLFMASHVPNPRDELSLFGRSMGIALFNAGLVWVLYIALEPFVRRRWPETLVSWKRLIAGRFTDPLVGRHVLYGAALGVGLELLTQLGSIVPALFGQPGTLPMQTDLDTLLGTRWVLGEVFFSLYQILATPMVLLFLLVLFRVLLRRSWLAVVAFVTLFMGLQLLGPEPSVISVVMVGLSMALICGFTLRFGLVSLIATLFFANELLGDQPMTLDFSTWYAGSTLAALATAIAVLLFAFRTSLGGRPLLSEHE